MVQIWPSLFLQKEKAHQTVCFFFCRYRLLLNFLIGVQKNLYAHKNTIFSFASFDKCDTSKAILLKYSNLLTRQSAIFPQLQCQPFVLIRRAYSFIQLHRFHTPKHLPVTNRDQTLCKIGENFRVVFQVIIKPQKCGN